jgi:hypothetical protein
VEGFPKLAEFWGGMGNNSRWRPAVYMVVTLPVLLAAKDVGPMVTTRILTYHHRNQPDMVVAESIQIGGRVLDAQGELPQPLGEVAVQLETLAGEALQATETNNQGQFTFGKLARDQYRLRARHDDLGEVTRQVEVPPPKGAEIDYYDLRLE